MKAKPGKGDHQADENGGDQAPAKDSGGTCHKRWVTDLGVCEGFSRI